jgi:ribosomal protein L7Ae-like RNA K-turn-binding protein
MGNINAGQAGLVVTTLNVTPAEVVIPVGDYVARLSGFKFTIGEFGPCIKLTFILEEGKSKGTELILFASAKIKKAKDPKYTSKLYGVVSSLLNRELADDEEVDFKSLLGKKCKLIVLQDSADKYPVIKHVIGENDPSPFERPKDEKDVMKGSPFKQISILEKNC